MRLNILIPTFRRPDNLAKCLNGLSQQTRKPDEIVIVMRPEDVATFDVFQQWSGSLPLRSVLIERSGVVQALNRGLDNLNADVVTITDDDSIPHPDWLMRIENHFERDPRLGGLGGRDIVFQNGVALEARKTVVGRVLPCGRIVGNHHLGVGPAREVDHLKGVNMSWRVAAIGDRRFDQDLRGLGAQVNFELGFSLEMKTRGWRIVYDPAVSVDHYPAARFDRDQRNNPSPQAGEDASYNLYLSLLRTPKSFPHRWAALAWITVIGTPRTPGLIRGLIFRMRHDAEGTALRASALRAWNDAILASSSCRK
jgi:glycosyltransferase involved in cell wall biosynthesis